MGIATLLAQPRAHFPRPDITRIDEVATRWDRRGARPEGLRRSPPTRPHSHRPPIIDAVAAAYSRDHLTAQRITSRLL